MSFRLCIDCRIQHYDDCPDCWGFGFRPTKDGRSIVAVTAREAHDTTIEKWTACEECGSTPDGPPKPSP